jgi:hypothetical protein
MKWFLGTYTARFNRRHKLSGHLFSGRYKALVVDGSGNGYLKKVCDYVHLNPARAKLLRAEEPLEAFAWSSYPDYLKAPAKRPGWLRVNRLLGEHRIAKDSAVGRDQFEAQMEQGRAAEDERDYQAIRRGWCVGEKAFQQELLEQVAELVGEYHYAEERQGSGEQKAHGIVAAELKRMGWTAEELKRRRKGDAKKVRIAQRLRAETTMTLKWIAEELQMGTWTHVSNLLSRQRRKRK